MQLDQMGRVAGLPARKARVDINPASQYWLEKAGRHMETRRLPCAAIADVFDGIGFADVDVLTIDTEGYDSFLLHAIDFVRIAPLLIELEAKSFSRQQLLSAQRLLELHGYSVLDANGSPDATHWLSRFGVVELFAVRRGGAGGQPAK